VSNTNFTPGPWFVFSNGHCVGGPCETSPTGTAGIAACASPRRSDDENRANAKLIAAARTLYTTSYRSEAIMIQVATTLERMGFNDLANDLRMQAKEQGLVLAQARGESPQ
jgi:hypothetical protein